MVNTDFDLTKVKLIAGLGNVGDKYSQTRHNLGFMFVDFLVNKLDPEAKFLENRSLHAHLASIQHTANSPQPEDIPSNSENILKFKTLNFKLHFAKPTTMMNASGMAIRLVKEYFKIRKDELLVVYDDLDLKFGEFKLQKAKSPKIHNGLNSVIEYLGSSKFWNLRIGVDNRSDDQRKFLPANEYVLSKFAPEEREQLPKTFQQIFDRIKFDVGL